MPSVPRTTPPGAWPAFAVLRLAGQVVEAVQAGLAARGFDDVRPLHGFAFLRIAAGDAVLVDVAAHLGVSKQAANQLVDQLVAAGYVSRGPHPSDRRAKLLALTERGWACTRAAEEAAGAEVARWQAALDGAPDAAAAAEVWAALAAWVTPGPIRPPW